MVDSIARTLTAAAFFAALAFTSPIAVQGADGPTGIGFAQAEEGTWWCQGATATTALDCARKKCVAEAGGQDCHATRWCLPGGWSALMVVWLPEFHSTHVLCGMPGQPAATAAMKAICDAGAEFTRCDLVLYVDPDGNAIEVTDISWPGPAARTAPAP